MIQHAKRKIVFRDRRKLGIATKSPIIPKSAIDVIVTDNGASEEMIASIRDRGISVILD